MDPKDVELWGPEVAAQRARVRAYQADRAAGMGEAEAVKKNNMVTAGQMMAHLAAIKARAAAK